MWDSWTGGEGRGRPRREAGQRVRPRRGGPGRHAARGAGCGLGLEPPRQRRSGSMLGDVGGQGSGRASLRRLRPAWSADSVGSAPAPAQDCPGPARRGVLAVRAGWGERPNVPQARARCRAGSTVRDDSAARNGCAAWLKAHDLGEKARELLGRDLREQQIERLLDRLLARQVGDEVVHRATNHRLGIGE